MISKRLIPEVLSNEELQAFTEVMLANPDSSNRKLFLLAGIEYSRKKMESVGALRRRLITAGNTELKMGRSYLKPLTDEEAHWLTINENVVAGNALAIAKSFGLPNHLYDDWLQEAKLNAAKYSGYLNQNDRYFWPRVHRNLKFLIKNFSARVVAQRLGVRVGKIEGVFEAKKIAREKGITFEEAAKKVLDKNAYNYGKQTRVSDLVELDDAIRTQFHENIKKVADPRKPRITRVSKKK